MIFDNAVESRSPLVGPGKVLTGQFDRFPLMFAEQGKLKGVWSMAVGPRSLSCGAESVRWNIDARQTRMAKG